MISVHLQTISRIDVATQAEVFGNCNGNVSEESPESDDDASDSLDHSQDSTKHSNN